MTTIRTLSFSDFSAAERNFLSSIRTNAIFVGLTMLLMNMKHYFASLFILFLCTALQLYITIDYYNHVLLQYDNIPRKNKNIQSNHFYPIIFSLQLIFILIVLLLITFRFYVHKK